MPKVSVLVTNDLNQDQRMHRICTVLQEKYGDVTLVGRMKKDSDKLLDQQFNQERLKVPFHKGILFYAYFNFVLWLYLVKKRPKMVYAVDLDTVLAARWYKMIFGGLLIFDAHEYFTEVPELMDATFKKKVWNMIGDFSIPKADLHLTVNDSLAEIFTKKYNRTFNVIRNVPILIEDKKVNKSDRNIVLYQGVLNKGRGLEVAIEVISNMPNYSLWIVGEGDLSDSLRALFRRLNQYDNIEFLGWKNPSELATITRNAGIGLNLLDTVSKNYFYSLANKFFDYMHAGIPSINMSFPEYQRINDQYNIAVLIDELNVDGLRQALDDLADEKKYRQLSDNALLAKKEFNWDNERRKMKALLDAL